jgi:hypothetical protein
MEVVIISLLLHNHGLILSQGNSVRSKTPMNNENSEKNEFARKKKKISPEPLCESITVTQEGLYIVSIEKADKWQM